MNNITEKKIIKNDNIVENYTVFIHNIDKSKYLNINLLYCIKTTLQMMGRIVLHKTIALYKLYYNYNFKFYFLLK